MLVSLWSAKGGAGTTVVAGALASVLAGSDPSGALLVDLAGELPAALGLPEADGPGVAAWCHAGDDVAPDGLGRIEVAVAPGVGLVPLGPGSLAGVSAHRAEVLAALLGAEPRAVVVDCGRLGATEVDGPARHVVAAAASPSLLVLRSCYLHLRQALAAPIRPTGVVLVEESGRALGPDDVEAVLDVPVVACIAVEATVARAVDAGLLAARTPRSLDRVLRRAFAAPITGPGAVDR